MAQMRQGWRDESRHARGATDVLRRAGSGQAGRVGRHGVSTDECVTVICTTKMEAVEWALAQAAAEWMICRDVQTDVWEHLR